MNRQRTPFEWRNVGGRWWPEIVCWLGIQRKSISEEDNDSVKCELSDYASTYTFCRSIGNQMVSFQYELLIMSFKL